MKVETSAALLVMLGVASARPDAVRIFKKPRHAVGASAKFRREVPRKSLETWILSDQPC